MFHPSIHPSIRPPHQFSHFSGLWWSKVRKAPVSYVLCTPLRTNVRTVEENHTQHIDRGGRIWQLPCFGLLWSGGGSFIFVPKSKIQLSPRSFKAEARNRRPRRRRRKRKRAKLPFLLHSLSHRLWMEEMALAAKSEDAARGLPRTSYGMDGWSPRLVGGAVMCCSGWHASFAAKEEEAKAEAAGKKC